MNLTIIHENNGSPSCSDRGLLRSVLSSGPIAHVVFGGLRSMSSFQGKVVYAVPDGWSTEHLAIVSEVVTYKQSIPILPELARSAKLNGWIVFSNGRFATQINKELFDKVLVCTKADVLAVNVESGLLASRERVRLTVNSKVAGFRRFYSDSAEPAPIPTDWPHHTFVRTRALDRVSADHTLPGSFSALLERFRSNQLIVHGVNVAGVAFDLETEEELLNFCKATLAKTQNSTLRTRNSNPISQDSKMIGKVLMGEDIHIDPKVIIVGPTIVSNNVTIGRGTVIKSSIIGSRVSIPENQLVQNRIVTASEFAPKHLNLLTDNVPKQVSGTLLDLNHLHSGKDTFRTWPRLTYARSFKRAVDFLVAIAVLILFAPIMPFIALAIKLDSTGPIFFKDRRQGFHGKEFKCLKFRSMREGADKIQEELRIASQVDGPQFKMKNDPRLSGVGRFLRDTYIDELPQFLNVLLGQMSVVGPRPSPKSENTSCPQWRDARLSVRPGITGLWQVRRTRQPMRDFQEWIYYDTEYVRNLSLSMDLWICWQTIKKMAENFVSQF